MSTEVVTEWGNTPRFAAARSPQSGAFPHAEGQTTVSGYDNSGHQITTQWPDHVAGPSPLRRAVENLFSI